MNNHGNQELQAQRRKLTNRIVINTIVLIPSIITVVVLQTIDSYDDAPD